MYKMQKTEDSGDSSGSSSSLSYKKEKKEHVRDIEPDRFAVDGSGLNLFDWLGRIFKKRNGPTLRETLEEYIEGNGSESSTSIVDHERVLIANILKLCDLNVIDIMIPRADIVSIGIDTSQKDLLSLLAKKQFSRLPVFHDTLDDVVGTIHIKDILSCLAAGKEVVVEDLVRAVPIVSPTMHMLDLLLMMQQKKRHMALVVDEFGGIDGLVTIGDVTEAIVGEIEDEYDQDDHPAITKNDDGSVVADARTDIDDFEEQYGKVLTDEEREDIDTLGGLVNALAGRVPARGEVLVHASGMTFEILEADPRRVNRLRIKNIPVLD